MPFSYNSTGGEVPGDVLSVPFPYLAQSHVTVTVDDVVVSTSLYAFTTASTLTLLAGFPLGTLTVVRRTTPITGLEAVLQGNAYFDFSGVNDNDSQLLYVLQERVDGENTNTADIATLQAFQSVSEDNAANSAAAAFIYQANAADSASSASSSVSFITSQVSTLAAIGGLADWGLVTDAPGTTTDYGDLN